MHVTLFKACNNTLEAIAMAWYSSAGAYAYYYYNTITYGVTETLGHNNPI